jgi:hypothetical protein
MEPIARSDGGGKKEIVFRTRQSSIITSTIMSESADIGAYSHLRPILAGIAPAGRTRCPRRC